MATQKIFVWIAGVIIILGGGYFLFWGSAPKSDDSMMKGETMEQKDAMQAGGQTMQKDEMMQKEDGAMMEGDTMMEGDAMMQKSGSYEAYAPEKLARAESGDVVLFFRASWCPTCKAVDTDIRANLGSIPAGLTILDIDYDNSAALKQKYGITYQHTFVQVDSKGTLIKKWSGSPTLAALAREVQ
ncbi:MAG: thioredoxin family protein [Candidatus Kaiserbacteria bacterium]|nr:MAG: thioredoxin family protein [Candidatus Kaiserbacteria bacterium]